MVAELRESVAHVCAKEITDQVVKPDLLADFFAFVVVVGGGGIQD